MKTAEKKEKYMHILEHVEEFRRRLIIIFGVLLVASIVSYTKVDQIRDFISAPAGDLVYIGVTEALIMNLRLAVLSGFLCTLPVIFYQIWSFILPALRKRERIYVTLVSFLSLVFFALGIVFAFLVILPFSVQFFLGFATDSLQPLLTFSNYLAFSSGLVFGFGLIFEMPVAVLILAKFGLISAEFLRHQRKYAVVLIFILSAFFTPPDVFSQIFMAIPMLLLYEISILLARLVRRSDKKQ